MPTLTIGDKSVEVDKSFLTLSPEEQNATVEEIAKSLGVTGGARNEVSGIADQFWGGIDAPLENMGTSMDAAGQAIGSESLQSSGKYLKDLTQAPENFVSGSDRFINPKEGDWVDPVMGFGWNNLPYAIAEQTGQLGGSIASRGAGGAIGGAAGSLAGPGGAATGAAVGAFAGPAAFEFIQQVGPLALQRAKNNGRSEPDWSDWSIAAAGAGASGALNAIGIKGVGKLNSMIGAGVKTAAKEGATEMTQSIVEQTTGTLGTDAGLKVDPRQAIGEGVIGAGSAGVANAPGVVYGETFGESANNRAVNREIRKNPFAATDAEIIQKVNEIASDPARTKGNDQIEVLTKNVNAQRNIEIDRVLEAAKALNLKSDAFRSLQKAVKSADGLAQSDWVKLASKDSKVAELKPLVDRVIRMRTLTQQTPTATGARRLAAGVIRAVGPSGGAVIGSALYGPQGAIAGIAMGQAAASKLARAVGGSRTQGDQIAKLVDPKLLRRADRVLEKVGPSQATKVMNDLEARRVTQDAARAAQAAEESRVKEILKAQMVYQKELAKKAKAEKMATNDAERKQRQKELFEFRKSHASLRAAALAATAQARQNQAQIVADNLAKTKGVNALVLQVAMEKLNQAKARTQKAENLAEKAGVKTAKHPLGTVALSKVKVKAYKESGIANPVSWEGSKQFLRNEFAKISDKIANTRDEKLKEIMIELRDAIDNSKNDTERRKAIYEAALSAAPAEYKVKLKETFNAFATFKFERQRTSE